MRLYLKNFYQELQYTPLDMVYEHHVLPARTRRVTLLGKVCRARVQKTLLGHEVKMSLLRKNCPDLVTARYLKIFASLGLSAVLIPYNPVETNRILPMLERSFNEINHKIETAASQRKLPGRALYYRRRIYHYLADRIRQLERMTPVEGRSVR